MVVVSVTRGSFGGSVDAPGLLHQLTGARFAQVTLPALINGAVGVVNAAEGRPISLMAFTIADAKIVAIDLVDHPGRIAEADLAIVDR